MICLLSVKKPENQYWVIISGEKNRVLPNNPPLLQFIIFYLFCFYDCSYYLNHFPLQLDLQLNMNFWCYLMRKK